MATVYSRLFAAALLTGCLATSAFAQSTEDGTVESKDNRTESKSATDKTHIGGYGEMSLKDPDGSAHPRLDISRFVIYLDHYFSDKWAFKSETEIEHVKIESGIPGGEVALEQAFLDYHANNNIAWRAGLLILPIGIMNQTHEPNTFYSVDRPVFEEEIIPTTWRELGTGIYGDLAEGIKYQLYVTEGLKSNSITAEGIREAGQEGTGPEDEETGLAGSDVIHPAISARLDFLPVSGLRIGASAYFQPVTTEGLTDVNGSFILTALDVRYEIGGLHLRGIAGFMTRGDADSIAAQNNHIFTYANGGYLEAAYNILPHLMADAQSELLPFVRYEKFLFRHIGLGALGVAEHNEPSSVVTAGIAFKPLDNVILKADYRWLNREEETTMFKQLNIGAGFSF